MNHFQFLLQTVYYDTVTTSNPSSGRWRAPIPPNQFVLPQPVGYRSSVLPNYRPQLYPAPTLPTDGVLPSQSFAFPGAVSPVTFAPVPGSSNSGFQRLNLSLQQPIYNIHITGNGVRDANGTKWRMRRLERELSFDEDQVLLMKKKVRSMTQCFHSPVVSAAARLLPFVRERWRAKPGICDCGGGRWGSESARPCVCGVAIHASSNCAIFCGART